MPERRSSQSVDPVSTPSPFPSQNETMSHSTQPIPFQEEMSLYKTPRSSMSVPCIIQTTGNESQIPPANMSYFIAPANEPLPKHFRRFHPVDFDDEDEEALPFGTWVPKYQEYARASHPVELNLTLPPVLIRALNAPAPAPDPNPTILSPTEYYNQYIALTTWDAVLSFRSLNSATAAIYDHMPIPELSFLPIETSLLDLLKTHPPDSPLFEPLTETILASPLSINAFTRVHRKLFTSDSDDAAMRAFLDILAFLRTLGRTRDFSRATREALAQDHDEIMESLELMLSNGEDLPLSATAVLHRIKEAIHLPISRAGHHILAAQVLHKEWCLWAVTSLAMSLVGNESASSEEVKEMRAMVEVGLEVRGVFLKFWDVWAFDRNLGEPDYTEDEKRTIERRVKFWKEDQENMKEIRRRLEVKKKRMDEIIRQGRWPQGAMIMPVLPKALTHKRISR